MCCIFSNMQYRLILITTHPAGNRKLKLKCPARARPGQSLAITVPVEKPDENKMNEGNGPNVKYIPDSDPPGTFYRESLPPTLIFYVHRLQTNSSPNSVTIAYMVTIPPDIRGGTKFAVLVSIFLSR